jgi:hypothetical protein
MLARVEGYRGAAQFVALRHVKSFAYQLLYRK